MYLVRSLIAVDWVQEGFNPLKRILIVIVLAILVVVPLSFAHAQQKSQPIHNETGSFTFIDKKGNPDKPITVWYYQPPNLPVNPPIVFIMHGIRRNARNYRDDWIAYAKQYSFLLVVPEFSKRFYPKNYDYNYGNMFDETTGKPISEDEWTFSAIEHLFDYIKQITENQSPQYWIYGHSAGGQFVHRMTLFKTDARIRRAIAANPGAYAMPNFQIEFPYGFKGTRMTPEKLKIAFGKDFILLLGDKDIKEDDPVLNETPPAIAQGKNRFGRGLQFYSTVVQNDEAVQLQLGDAFHWRLSIVHGAGHNESQMAEAAVKFLFTGSSN